MGGGSQSLYFTASTNHITGWSYDAAGNLLNDGVHAYTFDAESHIKNVDGNSAYVYDGGGQRVRKLLGENTRFVYGIGGQLIMEFDGSSRNLKKEYVYGGGTMATIAPNGKGSAGVQYLTGDNLGTPRVITNSTGSVVSRHDYMPFGEELFAGTGGRTTGMGFGVSDGNRQKFTGYERDAETGLDFAQARYTSSTLGRFTSPDPLGASMRPTSPQSFNRYAYVGNNPVNRIDPSGTSWENNASRQAADPFYLMRIGGPSMGLKDNSAHDFDWTASIEAVRPEPDPEAVAYVGDGIVQAGETPADEGIFNTAQQAPQPCSCGTPTDPNDRDMLAVLLGEASKVGGWGWGDNDSGPEVRKKGTKVLTEDDVFSEMIFMVYVVDNRRIDWNFSSWTAVIHADPDHQFKGYKDGNSTLNNLGEEGSYSCNKAKLGVTAIQSFHAQPIPRDTIRHYHFWKGIMQDGPKTGKPIIVERGNALRLANTDFSVYENRYKFY